MLALGIAGCISVPLSAIVRMSTFDERDFAALDPEVVRVRIKLREGFTLDSAASALQVKLTSKAGDHYGAFQLEQVVSGPVRLSGGIFGPDSWGMQYTLRLTAPSQKEFRALQGFVKKGRPAEVVIGVAPRLSSYPETSDEARVWVDLLLAPSEGFFALIDGADIPMEAIRAASAEQ